MGSKTSFTAKEAQTGSSLAAFLDSTGTKKIPANILVDANGDDAVGTAATGVAPPTGGVGVLGWMSGIYQRLGSTLSIRNLAAATDTVKVEGGNTAAVKVDAQTLTNLDTNIGAKADNAAADDTGSFSLIALTKRLLGRVTTLLSVLPSSLGAKAAAASLSITPATDAGMATAAKQDTGITILASLDNKLPSQGQKASSASLPVVIASDQVLSVSGRTEEAKSYFAGVAVVPTTLTTGLNYFWIRNGDSTKKIKIEKIEILMMFAGTAVASRSLYAIKKFTGASSTTGTVGLTPVPGVTSNPLSIADIKWAAAGGTLTGATVGGTIMEIGHPNQLTSNIAYDRDMTDAPIVLGQNEGIVLQSDGAVIAGTTVIISLRWVEE